jgi:hypothetical protein
MTAVTIDGDRDRGRDRDGSDSKNENSLKTVKMAEMVRKVADNKNRQ